MAKTIYRICLIVCLAIAIGAGLFFYERQQREKEEQQEWTLVQRKTEESTLYLTGCGQHQSQDRTEAA